MGMGKCNHGMHSTLYFHGERIQVLDMAQLCGRIFLNIFFLEAQ